MGKKILGILFFVAAALVLIGTLAGSSLAGVRGVAFVSMLIGTLLPVLCYILSGVFLCTFDKVYTMDYMQGFQKRKTQSSQILMFVLAYSILTLLVSFGTFFTVSHNFLLNYLKRILPYMLPLLVFSCLLGVYAIPFWSCKKNFQLGDAEVFWYLSPEDPLYTYCSKNSVLANRKCLFLPQFFCIVPYQHIAKIEFYNVIEKDIIFTLTNGKKVEIPISKSQYDSVLSAINTNSQS